MGSRNAGAAHARPIRAAHTAVIRAAAVDGSSHSQTQSTTHPSVSRSVRWRKSRAVFASSLSAHHWAFAFGRVRWTGHECQKSPITNTATRARLRTTSGRVEPTRTPVRNLNPRACRCRRNASSGAVPALRCRLIWRRTSSLLAAGRSSTATVSQPVGSRA